MNREMQDHLEDTVGRDLPKDSPRAFGIESLLRNVLSYLTGTPRKSVVLLGRSGVGKTALVHELATVPKLRVRRVSAQDIMEGTSYLGEWETKVRKLVNQASATKGILVYVPRLDELMHAGKCSKSDRNVLAALAPHIEDGSIVLLGETTPEAFRAGIGGDASLSSLFKVVKLEPASLRTSSAIVRRVAVDEGVRMPPSLCDRLVNLSDLYGANTVQPGKAVHVLREALRLASGQGALTLRDILEALSRKSGIPIDLLDDDIPIDVGDVRRFFESRVMGQGKATCAVTDLVVRVKAGVTEPARPLGVFFFAGPSGVGKTELAKAIANFMFGDASRLVRLDMSEYQGFDAVDRMIGGVGRAGRLTSAILEKPFSVVLLDEIEKAHGGVFDLFLQVFDAGRLTDGQGRTVDFGHTIFILTSNAGGTIRIQDQVPIGFATKGKADTCLESELWEELEKTFRREFLNRLDEIISFEPLGRDVVEKIAQQEVQAFLNRPGIRQRNLDVRVQSDVVSFVAREGYSRILGARALKRTVEKVLHPVTIAIAEKRIRKGGGITASVQEGRVVIAVDSDRTPEVEPESVPDQCAIEPKRQNPDNSEDPRSDGNGSAYCWKIRFVLETDEGGRKRRWYQPALYVIDSDTRGVPRYRFVRPLGPECDDAETAADIGSTKTNVRRDDRARNGGIALRVSDVLSPSEASSWRLGHAKYAIFNAKSSARDRWKVAVGKLTKRRGRDLWVVHRYLGTFSRKQTTEINTVEFPVRRVSKLPRKEGKVIQ